MKRNTVTVLALFTFITSLQAQIPSSTIRFEERIHDFGTIPEKMGKVSHKFVFYNKGTTPVVISDIYSGCGCIGQAVSKAPVKPGGKGEVLITFNPEYKSGFFSKEVVVYSNHGENYNRIWVEGKITPAEHPIENDYPYNFGEGLYLRLKVMAFGYLKPGEMKQMELHYANSTSKEMTLDFVIKDNKPGLKFTNPGKIPANAKGVITFSYTMPLSAVDDVYFTIYPYVNKKKTKEILEVKILNGQKLDKKDGKFPGFD